MRVKTIVAIVGGVLVIGGVIAAGAAIKNGTPSTRRVPTARVVKGSMKPDVWTTGEVRSSHVVSLAAPPAGGSLRLIRLVETGTALHAGDVVMEFDPAEQQYAYDQAMTELAEAEQQVIRRRADIEARAAQDQVSLLNARYLVRRAELDARMPERLIPANDFKKRALTLEEMKRRLAQTEHDMVSNRTTRRAALSVVEQGRNRSRIYADRARQIIDSLVVKSPVDGLVLVKENRDATGGVFFSGMSLPEFRPGDNVPSGRSIVDVSDPADTEIKVRVNEQERTTLVVGQAAGVRADSLPGQTLPARIVALSGVAVRSKDQAGPLRQFEAVLRLDQRDARLRSGTTVAVVIDGAEVRDALMVPRQAVFQRNGETVVYVAAGDGFEPRAVKVTTQSESRVAIQGVPEGAEIALVSPTTAGAASGPASAPALGGPAPAAGAR